MTQSTRRQPAAPSSEGGRRGASQRTPNACTTAATRSGASPPNAAAAPPARIPAIPAPTPAEGSHSGTPTRAAAKIIAGRWLTPPVAVATSNAASGAATAVTTHATNRRWKLTRRR